MGNEQTHGVDRSDTCMREDGWDGMEWNDGHRVCRCSWVTIPLASRTKDSSHDSDILRAHLVQVAILASHQNGRDTHVRQCKIYGPRQYVNNNNNNTGVSDRCHAHK